MKLFMSRLKTKGFTLIELMIVVAIIGILAAIAIPNFIRYQLRSKTAEAKTNLGGIKTSQESFRAEQDNYANITSVQPSALPGTVKTSWDTTVLNCTGCSRDSTMDCNQFDCIGFKPSGLVYYQYVAPHQIASNTTTAEFGAGAEADLDADGNFGQFAYRSANKVGSTTGFVQDGITNATNCPAGMEAAVVTDCQPGQY